MKYITRMCIYVYVEYIPFKFNSSHHITRNGNMYSHLVILHGLHHTILNNNRVIQCVCEWVTVWRCRWVDIPLVVLSKIIRMCVNGWTDNKHAHMKHTKHTNTAPRKLFFFGFWHTQRAISSIWSFDVAKQLFLSSVSFRRLSNVVRLTTKTMRFDCRLHETGKQRKSNNAQKW